MKKPVAFSLLAIALFAALSLVFGASYLNAGLFGRLPVGNVLTALGLCAASAAAIGLSARRTLLRSVSVAAFLAAAVWLPLSIALAGNLELNFSGSHGTIWLLVSAGTLALVTVSVMWALMHAGLGALARGRTGL